MKFKLILILILMNIRLPLYSEDSTGDIRLLSGYVTALREYPFNSNTILGVEAEDAPGYYDYENVLQNTYYQKWNGSNQSNIAIDNTFSDATGRIIYGDVTPSGGATANVDYTFISGFISQSGTSAPTGIIKQNTSIYTLSYSYIGVGEHGIEIDDFIYSAPKASRVAFLIFEDQFGSDDIGTIPATFKTFKVIRVLSGTNLTFKIYAYNTSGVLENSYSNIFFEIRYYNS